MPELDWRDMDDKDDEIAALRADLEAVALALKESGPWTSSWELRRKALDRSGVQEILKNGKYEEPGSS